jgi:hypothetical protein
MKIRYSERVLTDFPVIFAGDAYVGEGVVNNSGPSLSVGLAKIRWCRGRRFGVEFIRMPGGDQVRLGRLVKQQRAFRSTARLHHS